MAETIRVETKSAWLSKINWTQVVSFAASIAAVKGINLDADTQVYVVMAIQGIQGVVTWVLKTWFTPSITPASASVSGQKTMTLD